MKRIESVLKEMVKTTNLPTRILGGLHGKRDLHGDVCNKYMCTMRKSYSNCYVNFSK